jgi:hypothetical protein
MKKITSQKCGELLRAINALQLWFDDPKERYIQYSRFKKELKRM